LKIVLAIHHFPPNYLAGAELSAYKLVKEMCRRGYEIQVICIEHIDQGPKSGVSVEETEFEGIPVHRLSFRLADVPDSQRWEYDNLWIGDFFRQFLTRWKPDLFHLISGYLMSASALCAAQQLGIPSIVLLTDFWFLCPRINLLRSDGSRSSVPVDLSRCVRCLGEEKRRYRYPGKVAPGLMDAFWRAHKNELQRLKDRHAVLQAALENTDQLISPSRYLRDVYIRAGIRPEKITFIQHGLDAREFPQTVEAKPPSADLRIGYLGQIVWHKGVHVLLDAFHQVADERLKLFIYGDPSHFPDYAASIQRKAAGDQRIEFCGIYHGPVEQQRIFQGLDMIVVPSLWDENCPRVIIEAFANRVPVIASNAGGMAELISDGKNGLLFPLGSSDALAKLLRRLLNEPGLLPGLIDGIQPVGTFQEEMDKTERVYQQLLHQ
jgi:glycosyltransferase involved in cell wall biosynthesis